MQYAIPKAKTKKTPKVAAFEVFDFVASLGCFLSYQLRSKRRTFGSLIMKIRHTSNFPKPSFADHLANKFAQQRRFDKIKTTINEQFNCALVILQAFAVFLLTRSANYDFRSSAVKICLIKVHQTS